MQKYAILTLWCMVFLPQIITAQVVTIPDVSFKNVLLNENCASFGGTHPYSPSSKVDLNSDGIIQQSEANMVKALYINNKNIVSLEGINSFPNLEVLRCQQNQLTTLDLSNNHKLTSLDCTDNQLISLFIKTGNDFYVIPLQFDSPFYRTELYLNGNPNLQYICCDVSKFALIQYKLEQAGFNQPGKPYLTYNDYCSFVPGGTYYTVKGVQRYDSNNNGCDNTDTPYPYLKYKIESGAINGHYIPNSNGSYDIKLLAGTHTITPVIDNPSYFNVTPANITVNFPTDSDPYNQDFCITANGTKNDVEIKIIPVQGARPGFDTDYKILYRNIGNTTLSGEVNFTYDDATLDLVTVVPNTAVQNTGQLSWNYTNLKPFESQVISLTLNLNSPTETPSLNAGDLLNFTANITPVAQDETPDNNTFALKQTVVNSYDPNDKMCLEGDWLNPAKVGDYVHYRIRFENKGTASAVNVVVRDNIDANKFDISSLKPLHASHDFVTRINQNKVEFIFENINLPFDDANNDGYMFFKIKTKSTLQINDTFENKASIYFDFNPAIVTNTARTTVGVLSMTDESIDTSIGMHPNPASNVLIIQADNALKQISIYDLNGRVLNQITPIGYQTTSQIDISTLASGIYFIKVNSNKGQYVEKFIKK